MGRKQVVESKKTVREIKDKIEIFGNTTNLVVKLDLDETDGTFKVSTHFTTKQVDFTNPEITAGMLQNLANLMEVAAENAIQWAKDWAKANPNEGQLNI